MERDGERERLRRDLYRPGATEADRARYAALTTPAEPAAAPPPPPPRRARRTLPIAAVLVAGAAVITWPLAASRTTPPAAASSAPAARTAPDRSGEVRPISLTYADAGTVQAFHGRGDARVRLNAAVAPHDGGRMTVVLSPADTALIGWRAYRSNGRGSLDLLASRSVTERRGVAVPIEFPFTGDPPTEVLVEAPDRTAWTLVVTALRGGSAR